MQVQFAELSPSTAKSARRRYFPTPASMERDREPLCVPPLMESGEASDPAEGEPSSAPSRMRDEPTRRIPCVPPSSCEMRRSPGMKGLLGASPRPRPRPLPAPRAAPRRAPLIAPLCSAAGRSSVRTKAFHCSSSAGSDRKVSPVTARACTSVARPTTPPCSWHLMPLG